MELNDIKPGLRVKTTDELGKTLGYMVPQYRLDMRKPNIFGVVHSYVGGHGGDVWWVQHEGSDEAAPYMFNEFDPA